MICDDDKVNKRLSQSSESIFGSETNCVGDVAPPQFEEDGVEGADLKRYYSLCDFNRIFEDLDLSFRWKDMFHIMKL